MPCEAIWNGDGQWYNGVISDISEKGFSITFEGFPAPELIEPENIRFFFLFH